MDIIPGTYNFPFIFACTVAIFYICFLSKFSILYSLTIRVKKCGAGSPLFLLTDARTVETGRRLISIHNRLGHSRAVVDLGLNI